MCFADMYGDLMFNSIPDEQFSDYGIRIYKDLDIYYVNKEETQQRWNVLIFETDLYFKDREVMTSGIYVGTSLLPLAEIDCESKQKFKGYLFSVPFESWKALDIYGLEALFHSSEFIPYRRTDHIDTRALMGMMNLIYMSLGSANYYGKTEELTYLYWALMVKLTRCYKNDNLSFQQIDSKHTIAEKFVMMVNEHCPKERKLTFYASELGITTKYLSRVVSKATGKNANRWIRECTIKKCKEMLLTTSYSIGTLAIMMEFNTSSDFCKYFRNYAGMTPMKYRGLILPEKKDDFRNRVLPL